MPTKAKRGGDGNSSTAVARKSGAATGRGTVDKLVRVWTPEGEEAWVLIHVEEQSQHDPAFAERMYVYNHRLRDAHGRMPVSLAILGDESRSWRPDAYREGRWGCNVLLLC